MDRRGRGPLLAALVVLLGARIGATHPGVEFLKDAARDEAAARPLDPEAHLHEAKAHQVAGEWDAALDAYARALECGADPDEVGVARGQVQLAAGRAWLAKRELERVLARRPDVAGALLERGRTWRALGRPAKAGRDLRHAIARLPRPTPDQVFECRDALLAADDPDAAVLALDQGIARLGPVPSLELAAVELEARLDRPTAALRRIDRLLGEAPNNEAWVVRRGELLAQAGRNDEARAAFARALAMIEARPASRRPQPIRTMEERLRIALASGTAPTEGRP